MKKSLLALAAATAFAATLPAPPTGATTFPTLTTIYVASGVVENNTTANTGIMTAVSCTNMSSQTASVRYVFRYDGGGIAAGGTLLVGSLATRIVTTHGTNSLFFATTVPTGLMFGGSLQVLSTESAVFCSAMVFHPGGNVAGPGLTGWALHMARFNPHPGRIGCSGAEGRSVAPQFAGLLRHPPAGA